MAKLRNTTSPAVQLSISGGASSGQFKTPGIGPGQSLVVDPSADILLFDEDLEKSGTLKSLLDSGKLTKISDEEPADFDSNADVGTIQLASMNAFASVQSLDLGQYLQDLLDLTLVNDSLMQFSGGVEGKNGTTANTYVGTQGAGTTVSIDVTNTNDVTNLLNSQSTVLVTITGGTAASPTIDGGAGPVVKLMVRGTASMVIDAGATGTVILGLSSPTHPTETLDVTDTATVTLS